MKKTAIVLGAGSRGNAYAHYSLSFPEQLQIVGVAEPDADRRRVFAETYHVPEENCFEDWKEILSRPKMADAAFVCTMDNMHTEPAIRALELGYHVLLEKPMSNRPEECLQIERAAAASGKACGMQPVSTRTAEGAARLARCSVWRTCSSRKA